MEERNELLGHVPELDGVRGIAVLMVLILHFYDPVAAQSPFGFLTRVIRNGSAGVDVFFVLSGFLITGILVRSTQATNYFRAFYARRAVRIFPLYFLVIAFFFFVALPYFHRHGQDHQISGREQVWYWLFLGNWRLALGQNDGAQLRHLWSLAIEEQFYLVWSVIAWTCSARRLTQVSLMLVLASVIGRTVAGYLGVTHAFIYFGTFTRMDELLLGALLSLSRPFRAWMAANAKYLLPLSILLAVKYISYELNFVCYEIGGASLVALAASGSTTWLRMAWLRSFGKYSYALYVLHYFVHELIMPLVGRVNPFLFACGSIVFGIGLSYAAALLSWTFIEAPFLQLKKYVPYEFPTKSAARAPSFSGLAT